MLVPIALVGSGAFLSVMPIPRSYDRQIQLAGPYSRAYRRVEIHAHDQSWGVPTRALAVEMELVPNPPTGGGSATANVHPARMTVHPGEGYQYVAGGSRVTSQDAFGADAIIGWMNAAGIDTNAKRVRKEAAQIAGRAHAASRNGLAASSRQRLVGYSSSMSSGSDVFNSIISSEAAESHVPRFAPYALAAFWAVVWIAGVNHLSGRRIRPKAHADNGRLRAGAAMIEKV